MRKRTFIPTRILMCAEMSKTSEILREMKIYNSHELLVRFGEKRKTDICISYHPGFGIFGPAWQVYSPSHATDPKAHWHYLGQKSFSGRDSLPDALKWAGEKYGIAEWAPDPTDPSTKIPKSVREKALAAVKEYKSQRRHNWNETIQRMSQKDGH